MACWRTGQRVSIFYRIPVIVLTRIGLKTALSGRKSLSSRNPAPPTRRASSLVVERRNSSNIGFMVVVVIVVIVVVDAVESV